MFYFNSLLTNSIFYAIIIVVGGDFVKEQLQELRKMAKLKQEDAAKIFGVKLSTYQKYERDAISPPYNVLIAIADFYHVSTDYLLGRTTVKAMNTLPDDALTEEQVKMIDEAIVDSYEKLSVETRRAFIGMLEDLFGNIFERDDFGTDAEKKTGT